MNLYGNAVGSAVVLTNPPFGRTEYFEAGLVLAGLNEQKVWVADKLQQLKQRLSEVETYFYDPEMESGRSIVSAGLKSLPDLTISLQSDCHFTDSSGPVESPIPPECTAIATSPCSFCGAMTYDAGGFGIGAFIGSLFTRFVLQRTIEKIEEAFSQILDEIRLLIHYLWRVVIPCGFAVSQRRFFTHHGTHPPEKGSQEIWGLLFQRVFQPPIS